ncbi:reverse transcriptase domain-containing protein [Tanacetum coccineum]
MIFITFDFDFGVIPGYWVFGLGLDRMGAGLMLVSPEGKEYTYARRFEFETTNKQAHYEALLAVLRIAGEMEIKNLVIYIDSHLVVNQESKQESRRTKKVSFDDLRTSHQVSIGGSPNRQVNKQQRGSERSQKSQNQSPTIQADQRKHVQEIFPNVIASMLGPSQDKSIIEEIYEGPLPMAPGNLKFLAIALEHSTKWVEAKPLTTANGRQTEKFIWEHVICRTLPRNSQKETPFTLTYGSEAIILKVVNLTSKKEESVTQENAKRKEIKEREGTCYPENQIITNMVTFKLLEEETMAEILEQKMGWPFREELRVLEHESLLQLDIAEYVAS